MGELKVQPRGTRGESGGQTGITYDISNKHRLGYSEVELVQCMIDGVNTLYKEDLVFLFIFHHLQNIFYQILLIVKIRMKSSVSMQFDSIIVSHLTPYIDMT